MKGRSEEQLEEIRAYLMEEVSDHADIGLTMADGGEPVLDLHRVLTPGQYLALIQRFLG